MKICDLTTDHIPGILAFLPELSAWFDANAQKHIPIDLKYNQGFVGVDNGRVVGFIAYVVWEGSLKITWIGVAKDYQNQGLGTKLLHKLEEQARKMGIDTIRTYTLGDKVQYPPYEQSRKWYFKNGFTIYQRAQTDNPSCPEEIAILKKISLEPA